jgi:hypothetical protein
MKKPKKIMTENQTYEHLKQVNRLQHLLLDLQSYLKTQLPIRHIIGGQDYFWCGFEHDPKNPAWKPWQHLEKFCDKRGYDWVEVRDMIGDLYGRKLNCECEILTDYRQVRKDELKRQFGVDFESGEVGLSE